MMQNTTQKKLMAVLKNKTVNDCVISIMDEFVTIHLFSLTLPLWLQFLL